MGTSKRAVIITPLYDYGNSINDEIKAVRDFCRENLTAWEVDFLFVDFLNQDTLAHTIRSLPETDIHVVEGKGKKIKEVYLEVYDYVEESLRADIVVECDTHLANITDYLVELVNRSSSDDDYVVVSPYVKGAFHAGSFITKSIFFLIALIIRFILFVPFKSLKLLTDPFSPIKAFKMATFMEIYKERGLKTEGHGFKLWITYNFIDWSGSICEIPRVAALKKPPMVKRFIMNPFIIFKNLLIIRFNDKRTIQFLKFGTVGAIGFLVNAVFLEVFQRSGVSAYFAGLFTWAKDMPVIGLLAVPATWSGGLSVELAIISNFLFNNFWTFSKDKITNPLKFIKKLLVFNFTSFGAIIIQSITLGLSELIFGSTMLIRQATLVLSIIVIVIPYNWFIYNTLIWRKKKK